MNNNRIFEKVKMKIAISSVNEEDIVMETITYSNSESTHL